ncbi:MAG TPA: gluconate 2-dehydrogenase subunit 3 family protein [Flavisolibacter sp.]|jgi:hypothetical protein|nr:gluconate 2-dehydrogenase subunit 3 family protein [Flavisolibacter sp.]
MQRRTLLKQMVYVTGGVLLLPSCLQNRSKSSLLLKGLTIDGEQEAMVAELSETIIPATDTPGAKDISAHLFVLMMVDECYSGNDQKKFMAGLKALEQKTEKEFGKSYTALSPGEKEKLVKNLETSKDDKDDAAFFYSTVKKLTIRAYTTSKFFLTKVQVYELVPGRWHGAVPVKAA